jgi:hypothetical protein
MRSIGNAVLALCFPITTGTVQIKVKEYNTTLVVYRYELFGFEYDKQIEGISSIYKTMPV